MSEKSLQININSPDDARAVIQHLGQIKTAYDAHSCTSVEFVIAEEAVTPSAKILVGAIPWCTTFRKIVKPMEGNVLFQLPHYRQPPPPAARHPEVKPNPVVAKTAPAPEAPPARPAPPPAPPAPPPEPDVLTLTSIPIRPKSKPSASPEPLVQAHSGSD